MYRALAVSVEVETDGPMPGTRTSQINKEKSKTRSHISKITSSTMCVYTCTAEIQNSGDVKLQFQEEIKFLNAFH